MTLAYPGKTSELRLAVELPPAAPVTWGGILWAITRIGDFPFIRKKVNTTTFGPSMFSRQNRTIYEPATFDIDLLYTQGEVGVFEEMLAIDDDDTALRWWSILWPDTSYLQFIASVAGITYSTSLEEIITAKVDFCVTEMFVHTMP